MSFSDMLKKLRINKNLSQSELACELNVSKSSISMYENGNRQPDFETLEAIADFFNVDMNMLLDRKNVGTHYLDPEAEEIAQEMFERPELKTLFKTTKNVPAEDLKLIQALIDQLMKNNQ